MSMKVKVVRACACALVWLGIAQAAAASQFKFDLTLKEAEFYGLRYLGSDGYWIDVRPFAYEPAGEFSLSYPRDSYGATYVGDVVKGFVDVGNKKGVSSCNIGTFSCRIGYGTHDPWELKNGSVRIYSADYGSEFKLEFDRNGGTFVWFQDGPGFGFSDANYSDAIYMNGSEVRFDISNVSLVPLPGSLPLLLGAAALIAPLRLRRRRSAISA